MLFDLKNYWPFSLFFTTNHLLAENRIFFKNFLINPVLSIYYKPRQWLPFYNQLNVETIRLTTTANYGIMYPTKTGYLLGLVLENSLAGETQLIPQFLKTPDLFIRGLDFESYCSAVSFELESGQTNSRNIVIRVPWVKTNYFRFQKIELSVIVFQLGGTRNEI